MRKRPAYLKNKKSKIKMHNKIKLNICNKNLSHSEFFWRAKDVVKCADMSYAPYALKIIK